jgi:hypothetical protein
VENIGNQRFSFEINQGIGCEEHEMVTEIEE